LVSLLSLASLPQTPVEPTGFSRYSMAALASLLNTRGLSMNTAIKSAVLILLAVAAVKLYPDFARYMKIRAM
ncbi:MAG: hypothetical protein WAK48_05015, partial [Candidatus Acidiferrum sp.]